jgi:hypothetical protein
MPGDKATWAVDRAAGFVAAIEQLMKKLADT